MRPTVLVLLVALAGRLHAQGACPPAPVTSNDPQTASRLRVLSQQLLDAVGAGDTAVWSRILADEGVFVDEEGNVRDKRAILSELRPLPPGISGHICVTAPRAIILGDVAVLTYDAMEAAVIYGQEHHTHYHTTDTYVRRGDRWRLLGSHVAVLPAEHTTVAVRPETLDDFVGEYALTEGIEYRVTREGSRLYGERTGGLREELLPLGVDRFFRIGARRGERIFRRDASGRVDAMLDRRDNVDIVWRRAR
jgi:hypothetical protein